MKHLLYAFLCISLAACGEAIPAATERTDSPPDIFPDYKHVTIPVQIAPLNFEVKAAKEACAVFAAGDFKFAVGAKNGFIKIPPKKWERLVSNAEGESFTVSVMAKESGAWKAFGDFSINVSADPIDPYIAYRLVAPGYQLWGDMGIYQRELGSYAETVLIENSQTDKNCMNCHSFCNRDASEMLMHVRARHGCTVFVKDGRIEALDTKTDETVSALVYPYWHPSGKFAAFSVNNTTQDVSPDHRTEVYDKASDVVVYDVGNKEIHTTYPLSSKERFETFPAFSPDGKYLYFCTAPALNMPDSIKSLRYSLCRIAFDGEGPAFGADVDTIIDAEREGKSVLFPRISPDGKYLMCTVTDYGTFPIWHKDADLILLDLESGGRIDADEINSDFTESYHSWSSNGKWVVFSSRRIDGLHTRLFISHIGEGGEPSKPFLLPQKSGGHDAMLMKSYNIPEFVNGKISVDNRALASAIKKERKQKAKFAKKD